MVDIARNKHGPVSNGTGLSPFESILARQGGAINKLDRPYVKGGAMIEQCSVKLLFQTISELTLRLKGTLLLRLCS